MSDGRHALGALPTIEILLLLGIPAVWLVFLAYFIVACIVRQRVPRSARFEKMGRAKVVPRFFLEYGYWMLTWQTRIFMAVGLTANMMTMLSLVLAGGGAYYIALGRFCLGGWLMFVGFFCDAYDGIIARAQGTASARGEYFDSFIDRYADLVTGFGFLWYYRDDFFATLVVALGMIGSSAMGYARAKGEAVGVDPNVGVMQRHERAVWIGVTTVTGPIFAAYLEPEATYSLFTGGGGLFTFSTAILAPGAFSGAGAHIGPGAVNRTLYFFLIYGFLLIATHMAGCAGLCLFLFFLFGYFINRYFLKYLDALTLFAVICRSGTDNIAVVASFCVNGTQVNFALHFGTTQFYKLGFYFFNIGVLSFCRGCFRSGLC